MENSFFEQLNSYNNWTHSRDGRDIPSNHDYDDRHHLCNTALILTADSEDPDHYRPSRRFSNLIVSGYSITLIPMPNGNLKLDVNSDPKITGFFFNVLNTLKQGTVHLGYPNF